MTMRRLLLRSWAGLSCLALLASGCGKDPFGPPSRSKAVAKVGAASGSKPDYLVFVVPEMAKGDVELWAYRAQIEANARRAIFRIWGPRPGESTDLQGEAVRRAVADGATALIVYPGSSPDLPKALAEAEAKGVPVVLLDRSVPAPEGSKPFTVIDYGPFDATAKQIVAATIEDLKKASQPVDGTAIILVDKVTDGTSGRRVAALKAAAESAKFKQVVAVEFAGTPEAAKAAALEAIKAHPDVSVILTDDVEGMAGAAVARSDSKGKPVFFVGGYTDYRSSTFVTPPERESCYVEGRFSELGAQAVFTVLAKHRGEQVGEHVYLTPKFTKTEGAVSSETIANSSYPEMVKGAQSPNKPESEPEKKGGEPEKKDAPKPQ
jgi:ABC-type sugar transport system substrate-binding protein